MRDFKFFVSDRRHAVPTLSFVVARDEERARELALKALAESPHHLSVEVHEGDALLFIVPGEAADPTARGRPSPEQPASKC